MFLSAHMCWSRSSSAHTHARIHTRTYGHAGTRCTDTVGWVNPAGHPCSDYETKKSWCKNGRAIPGQEWTLGEKWGYPERHCCACGKGGSVLMSTVHLSVPTRKQHMVSVPWPTARPSTTSSASPTAMEKNAMHRVGPALTGRDVAHDIVRKAYNETYARIRPCPPEIPLPKCLARTLSRSPGSALPWWFRTLIRDVQSGSGIEGRWHFLRWDGPPMQMCSIEKLATTQWRKVSCHMNSEPFRFLPCNPAKEPRWKPGMKVGFSDDMPKIVFLRDPLERFLSAFVDKCIFGNRTRANSHCQPGAVWQEQRKPDLLNGLWEDKRALFEVESTWHAIIHTHTHTHSYAAEAQANECTSTHAPAHMCTHSCVCDHARTCIHA